MKKRIGITILALVLFLCPSLNVLACNEEQTKEYVSNILFGDQASRYESNKDVETLLSALYICSEQADKAGQSNLNELKKAKVRKLPALADINVSQYDLLRCAHNSWSYEANKLEDKQEARKNVLKNTVIKTFDFGFFKELFQKDGGQIDSFSALLYYTHILADYIAADPKDTEVSAKGYDIPAYTGVSEYQLNGNVPSFTSNQKKETGSYKEYSDLDAYDRCGMAISCIGPDTLSYVGPRNDNAIKKVMPSGWEKGNKKYEGILAGDLYNRSHLIAHQLGGADTRWNLITGTRYLNENMIPYENKIANHIKTTGNHVLYRVTPVYEGDNQVASGVQLEAYSIEDKGSLSFNVYLYNVQPGVNINYSNGSSTRSDNIYGESDVIPFAVPYPSNETPDLMFEIQKELEKLFSDQKNTNEYECMLNELDVIADEARRVSGDKEWKVYSELKQYQYKYVETLAEYVPKLLENEKFFKYTFN